MTIQMMCFEYIGCKVVGHHVATFNRSGDQTRQEVIFDLFLFFRTSQNLTGIVIGRAGHAGRASCAGRL